MRKPQSLFAKTYLTLTVTLLLFVLLSAIAVVYFILVPVSTRAANDFASLIVLSGKTWVELPPETRRDFERELAERYDLVISAGGQPLSRPSRFLPYVKLLESALRERTGETIPVRVQDHNGVQWFALDMTVAGHTLRFSFPHARIGARPPTVLLYVLALGVVLILLASLYLVRKVTEPITRLLRATETVGRGSELTLLPETGPREIQALTRHFNKMSTEVSALLVSRSTLFAGISHDLRTPITRIQLALELLAGEGNSALVERIRRDLEEMNELIGDTLDLSRGLTPHPHETVELYEFLSELVLSLQTGDEGIRFDSSGSCVCTLDTVALRRVLTNLIENALRYGESSAVEVYCRCTASEVIVEVLDRGPGIPEADREAVMQPFYRLEHSRSRVTGGSGLGLAIVQHLCDFNGWSIELASREGGGTRAVLTIPLHPGRS